MRAAYDGKVRSWGILHDGIQRVFSNYLIHQGAGMLRMNEARTRKELINHNRGYRTKGWRPIETIELFSVQGVRNESKEYNLLNPGGSSNG
jgi:hypothetical protein